MKKSIRYYWNVFFLAVCMLALSLFAVACETAETPTTNKAPLKNRLTGFEVVAEETVEIGSYYTPKTPDVKMDGESVHVSVSAEQNGKMLFFNGNNDLLIAAFEDITVTYTVSEQDESVEKSTVLKVADNGKPYIRLHMPEKLYRGETYDFAELVEVADHSGENITPAITLTDENGGAVALTDGKLVLAENSPLQSVTLAVLATDSHNNTETKEIVLPVKDLTAYDHPFNFSDLDINKLAYYNQAKGGEIVEKDGEAAIKISGLHTWNAEGEKTAEQFRKDGAHIVTTFSLIENMNSYLRFDHIKVTVSAEANCHLTFYGAEDENAANRIMMGDTTKHVVTYDMAKVAAGDRNVVREGCLTLNAKMTTSADSEIERFEAALYVYDIEFVYAEKKATEYVPFDWQNTLGLDAADIVSAAYTPENGAASGIADVAAFAPEKSGTLTVTLKKDGYKKTVLTVKLNVVEVPVQTEDGNDTDSAWGENW